MSYCYKGSQALLCIFVLFFSSCSLILEEKKKTKKTIRKRPVQQFSGVRKKAALLTFLNESPYGGEELAMMATEELREALSKTQLFIMTNQGNKIFGSSKEIYAGGGLKLSQLYRQAKTAGIHFVIFGRIIESRVREKKDEIGFVRRVQSYADSKIEIRLFDVNSNKEAYSSVVEGYADDEVHRFFASSRQSQLAYRQNLLEHGVKVAVRKSVPKIVQTSAKLDWVGRVAKIIGKKIYINAGRRSGLQINDVLKAMTEGSEIYDPTTGGLIGISKGEIKGTLEIIDYFGPDGSIAILHSGGAVHEGDFVQLY